MIELNQSLLEPENLVLILDNLKLGIIAHTSERIITVFNKEAERITGYSKKEVIGKDCHKIFGSPFCGNKCSFCDDSQPFSSETKEYPLSFVDRDGVTHQLEMIVSAIINQAHVFTGVLASLRDVTDTFNLSLKAENISSFAGIIGQNKLMQDIFRQISDVALYNYPVCVSGETGTGKERVALAIHDISAYGNGSFVPVNCGAIPEGIVESELFGHVKGAFSGAIKDRKGRFELAHKGTLFLDEVAELPLNTQVKLLRFLQEGSFEKVGGEKKVAVDVRIISASNKNLKDEVKAGRFREDLFYRLNVIPVHLPPLRQRKSDIPLLLAHFLKEAEQENPNPIPGIAPESLNSLMDYHWPGNVRELKNVIQFSVVRSRGDQILPDDLPAEITQRQTIPVIEEDFVKTANTQTRGKLDPESVKAAVKKAGGNKSKAAKLLGVGRATLYRFLSQYNEVKEYTDSL